MKNVDFPLCFLADEVDSKFKEFSKKTFLKLRKSQFSKVSVSTRVSIPFVVKLRKTGV